MKSKRISPNTKEMINLKAENENLKNVVAKLQEDYISAKERSRRNYEIAQDRISKVIALEREKESLKSECERLKRVNSFELGKGEAYETVIKQLIEKGGNK